MEGTQPDYTRCVAIAAAASLKEMQKPGRRVAFPIAVGVVFRFLGEWQASRCSGPWCSLGCSWSRPYAAS